MTPTPDPALAARLAELAGESYGTDCIGDDLEQAMWTAYRSGQIITIADHERAVQAAVAKAVEAERQACALLATGKAKEVDDQKAEYYGGWLVACSDISAAIRARKGDAL